MAINRSYFMLPLFIALVSGVALSGAQFQPGEWYEHLSKPFWTPPNRLFPIAWSLLYLMIAIAGWLIFKTDNGAMKMFWGLQLVLNGLWSWLFFGLHSMGAGLLDILALLGCICAIVIMSIRTSKTIFWLSIPYLIWVGYASTLNAAIYVMNFD